MAGSPEAPRRKEQVEVRHPWKRAVEPRQCESRFEQRKIERRAVVCDDKLESLDELGERMQHGRLFIEVPDEVLNHMKLVAGKVAKADEKRTHARAALHPCRLGIEKHNAAAFRNAFFLAHQVHEAFKIRC